MARPQKKRQRWSDEEDHKLIEFKRKYPNQPWSYIAKQAGLSRKGKSCGERWTNHLNPDVNKGIFSQEEDDTIIRLHEFHGNRWAAIASELQPQGFRRRTADAVKNRWNNHLNTRTHQNITDPQSFTSHQPDATQVANIHFQQYSNIPNASFMVNQAENQTNPSQETSEACMGILEPDQNSFMGHYFDPSMVYQAENQITPAQETSEAYMGILEPGQSSFMGYYIDPSMVYQAENQITPAQEISEVNMGILEQCQNYFMQGFDPFMVNPVENQITPAQESFEASMGILEPDQNCFMGSMVNQAENQINPAQQTSEAFMGILEQKYFMGPSMVNQAKNQIIPTQETSEAFMGISESDQNYIGEYNNYDPWIPGPGSFSVENELMLTEEAILEVDTLLWGDFFEPGSVSLENLWI